MVHCLFPRENRYYPLFSRTTEFKSYNEVRTHVCSAQVCKIRASVFRGRVRVCANVYARVNVRTSLLDYCSFVPRLLFECSSRRAPRLITTLYPLTEVLAQTRKRRSRARERTHTPTHTTAYTHTKSETGYQRRY